MGKTYGNTRKPNYGKRVLAKGIEITNNTRISGLNNNDLVVGNSGCGKTGGYVIPNLQNIDGSMVVADTKGQLAKRFTKELKEKGYKVHTLDLVNPMKSCGYNPMSFIRRYQDGSFREQDVLTLARGICPPSAADEPIWDMSAASYVAFLISYCLETEPKERQNLITVGELHRQFSQPNGDIPFLAWIERHRDSFAAKKYFEINANRVAEKMFGSIMGFVNVDLEPFSFKEARYIFGGKESFDIRSLGRRKTVIFLNISDTDRTFDQMANIFYTQALQLLCDEADRNDDGRLKVPVRLIFDDFAASARIPDFDKIISVIRSRDISVSLLLQSLSQLESMYDVPASRTIVNNCDHILFLGSQDFNTAEFIGTRANKTPETILAMPRTKAYLIRAGETAKLVDKIRPYSTVADFDLEEEGAVECQVI